ncbi:polysaccharide deacetylase family protein [Alicyclobacillus cycloheptanicus]|uniref:Peptidoglycan/xylan/chitin deacetylase (PgdA/CDA1 family) n=1 Tax=Alicyclobacillus cycloheptanicus TaxID=1457 RepID=A0ABT9XNU6_9BACL|nr:polysaccharide deacetylase family protein [Alicyclobacillus cycloheptanicus]MDQ0191418.1 peptidoglycan/xylan/chitin deacetylase (PgdA/CDA1 family) [Alicyclobacillus cycloheptanicus]WDM02132.1 polysaccharide deacetylase family protein [Alicyclobacillus cycloheptanicus]
MGHRTSTVLALIMSMMLTTLVIAAPARPAQAAKQPASGTAASAAGSAAAGAADAPAASHKTLYLTFDDGPSQRYTPQILDILRREHVRATFFVLGSRSQEYPGLVRRIRLEGHELGNHGFYHEVITGKPDVWVRQDVTKAERAIRAASGVTPVLYRPPGGMIDQREMAMLTKAGHPVVLWTLDSGDWRAKSAAPIVNTVLRNVQPGAIVLFHDGISPSRYTAQALPKIIRVCRARGYTFELVPVGPAASRITTHADSRQ